MYKGDIGFYNQTHLTLKDISCSRRNIEVTYFSSESNFSPLPLLWELKELHNKNHIHVCLVILVFLSRLLCIYLLKYFVLKVHIDVIWIKKSNARVFEKVTSKKNRLWCAQTAKYTLRKIRVGGLQTWVSTGVFLASVKLYLPKSLQKNAKWQVVSWPSMTNSRRKEEVRGKGTMGKIQWFITHWEEMVPMDVGSRLMPVLWITEAWAAALSSCPPLSSFWMPKHTLEHRLQSAGRREAIINERYETHWNVHGNTAAIYINTQTVKAMESRHCNTKHLWLLGTSISFLGLRGWTFQV